MAALPTKITDRVLVYETLLAGLMFLAAALYTTMGHAGASAHLVLMALFRASPAVMRPVALVLNIIVATFTAVRFFRAGQFRWRVLWPFLIGAIAFGFIGGEIGGLSQLTRDLDRGTRAGFPGRLTAHRAQPRVFRHGVGRPLYFARVVRPRAIISTL